MAQFGKIFGVMTSLVGIGGSLGSVAAGAVFDHLESVLIRLKHIRCF